MPQKQETIRKMEAIASYKKIKSLFAKEEDHILETRQTSEELSQIEKIKKSL